MSFRVFSIIFCSYAFQMNKTFSVILLVQPLMTSLAIIISLFCVMVNYWYAGIGYIIFAYNQLISMCAVGQSVQNNVSFTEDHVHFNTKKSNPWTLNRFHIPFKIEVTKLMGNWIWIQNFRKKSGIFARQFSEFSGFLCVFSIQNFIIRYFLYFRKKSLMKSKNRLIIMKKYSSGPIAPSIFQLENFI